MARDLVAGRDRAQQRPLRRLAAVERLVLRAAVRAARVEAAAGRRVAQVGRRAWNALEAGQRPGQRRGRRPGGPRGRGVGGGGEGGGGGRRRGVPPRPDRGAGGGAQQQRGGGR